MKKFLFCFLVITLAVFSSCEKDKGEWVKDYDDKDRCFELVYPITYIMPDGSAITADDEEALKAATEAWYDNHPDVAEKPTLQYPVQITFDDDDEIILVDDQEEMEAIKEECKGDEYDDECFDLVYPVTFIMPDGATITGDHEEELFNAIKNWYEAHPDVVAEAVLQYPVQVTFNDVDQIITVNNEEEMETIKEACEGEEYNDECFDLVYPITFIMPDGSTISGNSEAELDAALESWYNAHPDVVAEPTLQFPVQIIVEYADQPITINSEEELEVAYDECD